ncbi:MAG: ribbon-helix-helix domain-containing protein [Pseudolabrys sp.]|jgi:predicted DNA-binding ribbon-helix-helix protein
MITDGYDDDHAKIKDNHSRSRSRVIKHLAVVGHRKTSVSLEEVFWNEFRAIARERKVPLSELVDEIDSERTPSNLSSAIQVFVFGRYRRSN